MKTTVAQLLKHDFKSKGKLKLYDSNGKVIYYENSSGYWYKQEFDSNGNIIYAEWSDGDWEKTEYDTNGKVIYFECSNGEVIDDRPKKDSSDGKVVEIDGKQYKLTAI
jgi:hypothetical protein